MSQAARTSLADLLPETVAEMGRGLVRSRAGSSKIFGRTLNKITRWPRHVATRTSSRNPHTTSIDVTSGTVY